MSLKGFLLGALVALAASPADGQPLRVMGFSGSSNWPIFVAQEKGLFKPASTPWRANSPFSCATKIGQLEQPFLRQLQLADFRGTGKRAVRSPRRRGRFDRSPQLGDA